MRETNIVQNIRLDIAKLGIYWRNNVGALKDTNGRLVKYGLCVGSSDLVGFTPMRITQDMVGQTVAVFTAIEVKVPGKNPTPEQVNFITAIQKSGGIAGVARSVEDARKIILGGDAP